jgi:hypothetical protein
VADTARDVVARVDVLKRRYAERDARMQTLRAVRGGRADLAFSGLFPTEWPRPIVANFIDGVARDVAEMVGVLPTITAQGDTVLDERAASRADKRTRIANAIVYQSRVGTRLLSGADQYVSYGFLPLRVEPNFEGGYPHIQLDDPMGAYPEFDRWGAVTGYAKRWTQPVSQLCALYPELRGQIIGGHMPTAQTSDSLLEVVRWWDRDRCVLLLPQRNGLVLDEYANPISRVPVVVARRPGMDDELRGQFDDVLWVYAAKAKLALMSLEAVQKAVEAPIALPQDVQHLPIGGDAFIRSATPEKIRRVPLELPQSAIMETGRLDEEMRMGSRYPQSRTGETDASVVTGRGIQALQGGFDTQVKTAQALIGEALCEAVSLALEYDEKVFGGTKKTVQASVNGSPYELTYDPAVDIRGQYGVSIEYGFMAGLDPNRALVWGLQARGDKLISRSYLRRNIPVNMNVSDEERVIDVEEMRDALKGALVATSQSIPEMVAQGQPPSDIINMFADLIDERKKGTPIEVAAKKARAQNHAPK